MGGGEMMMRRGGGKDNLHGEVILRSHLGASPLNSLNLVVGVTIWGKIWGNNICRGDEF